MAWRYKDECLNCGSPRRHHSGPLKCCPYRAPLEIFGGVAVIPLTLPRCDNCGRLYSEHEPIVDTT